jgi:hypothetical protein
VLALSAAAAISWERALIFVLASLDTSPFIASLAALHEKKTRSNYTRTARPPFELLLFAE